MRRIVFFASEDQVNMNPLHKIGYESVPGRTFCIDLKYNQAENQVDAIINGMQKTIPKFKGVAAGCTEMMSQLDEDRRIFFNDNLRIFCHYMYHLSKTLYHYVWAYKYQEDRELLVSKITTLKNRALQAK